jgi:type IV pilus assembly protein PilB
MSGLVHARADPRRIQLVAVGSDLTSLGARRAVSRPVACFVPPAPDALLLPRRPPPFMAAPLAVPERLGELLVREKLVSREQLDKALQEQKQSGTRVGYNLVKLGFIQETELTKILARQYKMPAVDLTRFEVDPRIAKLVPAELAMKHLVLPLKRDGRTLTVAIADPSNLGVLEDLKFITRYDIFPVIGGEFSIKTAVDKIYEAALDNQVSDLMSVIDDMAAEGDVEVLEDQEEDVSAAALQAQMEDAPVVKLLNAILTDAVKRGASDIHFECFEHDIRVRYRIDGALQEVMKPPMKLKAALISRFKIMAQLNIAERRVPQDGRIKLKMGKKVIDYRVSTLPTLFGEKIVLRILDKGNLTLDLEKFGIEPKAEKDLMEAVQNPYGMVLVTGPTGSGKTTTLYSALSKVNNIDVNIMTAEDPVEYNLYGVNQVLVRTDIGMTFAAALKAFLRQDPNIIMVGEIRDLETGGIAIKAALTGHMVLSTLHTNSAPETVTRLMDMGLEPFNVASALNLVLAQRLLRRICPSCKEQYTPNELELNAAKVKPTTTLRDLKFTGESVENAKAKATKEAAPLLKNITLDTTVSELPYFRGRGCDACGGTGMKGRQGVYEVMPMSPNLRKLILMNVGAVEIRDAAIEEGMLTLRMDGWMKVMKGITTLEQVIRETTA